MTDQLPTRSPTRSVTHGGPRGDDQRVVAPGLLHGSLQRPTRGRRVDHSASTTLTNVRMSAGSVDIAGRSMKQLDTQRRFEITDALAYHRFRNVQARRGGGYASSLHHAHECQDVVETPI